MKAILKSENCRVVVSKKYDDLTAYELFEEILIPLAVAYGYYQESIEDVIIEMGKQLYEESLLKEINKEEEEKEEEEKEEGEEDKEE